MLGIYLAVALTTSLVLSNPTSNSDDSKKCGNNEYWSDCALGVCAPKTCEDLGFPVACPGLTSCEGGCVCKEGFVKKSDACIPAEECPSCHADFNATVGDDRHCGNLCWDKKSCYQSFEGYNGCKCKEGFVFDDINQRCVNQEDCPEPCGGDPYAEKKECASAERCHPTCASPTPKLCTRNCVFNGCECRPGYILDKKGGKCIKIRDCPDDIGCNDDPNAIVSECGSACPLACTDKEPVACIAVCVPLTCVCKPGYVLSDPKGKCVEINKCEGKPYWLQEGYYS